MNTRYTRLNENTRKLVKKPQSRKLINNDYKKDSLSKDESKLPDENILDGNFLCVLPQHKNRIKLSSSPQPLEMLGTSALSFGVTSADQTLHRAYGPPKIISSGVISQW
jgi:hypothetical protein